jgi:hypothetical protein
MNSKVFGSRTFGVFPHGMPARLAFWTNCIRRLFETESLADYFFISMTHKSLQIRSVIS